MSVAGRELFGQEETHKREVDRYVAHDSGGKNLIGEEVVTGSDVLQRQSLAH